MGREEIALSIGERLLNVLSFYQLKSNIFPFLFSLAFVLVESSENFGYFTVTLFICMLVAGADHGLLFYC